MRVHRVAALLVLLVALSAGAQPYINPLTRGDVVVSLRAMTVITYRVFDSAGYAKIFNWDSPIVFQLAWNPLGDAGHAVVKIGAQHSTGGVPMRSGEFLVGAELYQDPVVPRIVKFDDAGTIQAVYTLPYETGVWGVQAMELLSDQCTVVWLASVYPGYEARRFVVRTFDICTSLPGPERFTIPDEGSWPQFIRKLPNGDFLIATYAEVARYSAGGTRLERYPVTLLPVSLTPRELTSIALAPDGSGFWLLVTGSRLVKVDLPTSQTEVSVVPFIATDYVEPVYPRGLTVYGEWRASLQPPPPPPAKRRAVRR